MSEWTKHGAVETLEVISDERRTLLIRMNEDTPAGDVTDLIDISQARVALLILGGGASVDAEAARKLKTVICHAIVPSARSANALLLDCTPPETMKVIGSCVAYLRQPPLLSGVVPEALATWPGSPPAQNQGTVPLDLNHSHFILCSGNRLGDEWGPRYRLVRAISGVLPVTAVLVNGGDTAQRDLLSCVRQGWHVIVVEGSGGLADTIAALKKPSADLSKLEPELMEIVQSSGLHIIEAADPLDTWAQAIEGRPKLDATLMQVWDDYRRWDSGAVAYQKRFRLMQWSVVLLGILAILLGLLLPDWQELTKSGPPPVSSWVWHYTFIVTPLLMSGLIAFMNRFRHGNRWILLRGGAEAIKREVFRYRTRTGIYSDDHPGTYRGTLLAQEVDKISKALAQSEVNRAGAPALPDLAKAAPGSPVEDPLSVLTGDQYAIARLQDQIKYYEKTTRKLDGQVRLFHALIYVAGGGGTFLAAIGANIWVALTTAVGSALTARLEAEQKDATLAQYNQALAALKFILNRWNSLSALEKEQQRNLDRLVEDTEDALKGELAGWVQQMQTALDKAQKQLEEASSKPAPDGAAGKTGTDTIAKAKPEPEPEPQEPLSAEKPAETNPPGEPKAGTG